MFSLWGKIRLDGTEAKKDAAKVGTAFGNQIGQQFSSTMKRFIGAGALISLGQRQVAQATAISTGAGKAGISVEAFQELTKAADHFGISVEELQKVAPQLGKPFEEYMDLIRKKGGIMDKDTVAALVKTGETVEGITNQMAPGIAGATDFTGRTINALTDFWSKVYGGGTAAVGALRGDEDLERLGEAMWDNAGNPFRHFSTPAAVGESEQMRLQRENQAILKRIHEDANKNNDKLVDTLTQ